MYKAVDRESGAVVLLKRLRPTTDPERRQRFLDEARLAAAVDHPNVVRVLHTTDDALVAEWVEGTDLQALLRTVGPLPVDLATLVARDAARGLAAVHASGILHRDVSAANVLVGADGVTRLTDFGLASLAPDPDEAEVRGTLTTLAPEVVRGETPTASSDLFSLGAVWVHALTGQPPFAAKSASDTLDAILHTDPVAALAEDPRLPPSLVGLLARLLSRDPAARPASSSVVADELTTVLDLFGPVGPDALAAFLADPPGYRTPPMRRAKPVAPPMPVAPRVNPPLRTRRWPWPALAVVGVIGLAVALQMRAPRTPDRQLAEEPTVPALAIASEDTPDTLSTLVPDLETALAPPEPDLPADALPSAPPDDESAAPDRQPDVSPGSPVEVSEPDPPASPPVVAAPGELAVVVEPWARVRIDGRDVGTTPFDAVTLPAGDHELTFANPEFPPYRLRVLVKPGERTRTVVSLWDLVGRVTLEVSPWAEVSVDGVVWDTVPPQSRPLVLPPGRHMLAFVHPTLGREEVPIQIAAGEQRTVRVRLSAADG
ncbi:MAG: hypothetical protein Rubg2KO_29410 [Rubricoccaceae bacterium]